MDSSTSQDMQSEHPTYFSLDISEILEKLRTQYGLDVVQDSEHHHLSNILECIDKDVASHQEEIQCMDKDIAGHYEEIRRLQDRIDLMNSKCNRAQSIGKTLKALNSPIRRLPNELLVNILEYSCAQNDFRNEPVRVPALAASVVSSRWRQLALSTPQLWANFCVELIGSEEDYDKEVHLARLINRFLRRSGKHPLSVDIRLPSWDPVSWGDHMTPDEHPVLEAVFSNAYRLEAFAYTADSDRDLYHCQWDPPPSMPILRRASVSHLSNEEYMDVHFFQNSSNLKELTVQGWYEVDDELNDAPGYSIWSRVCQNLTHLGIHTASSSLFRAIGLCTQLSTLRLDVTHDPSVHEPDRPEELLLLPTLHSLHMQGTKGCSDHYFGDMVRLVLSSLSSPSLEELAIVPRGHDRRHRKFNCDYSGPWPGEEILGLLKRSKCVLTKLKLEIQVSGDQLVSLLHHLGSVRELTFDGRHIDVTIASSFIPKLHGFRGDLVQPLIPKLSRLSLVIRGTREENNFNDGKFVDMVLSRWDPELLRESDAGFACLKSVSLHFMGKEVDSGAYESLRILERSGLDLVLTDAGPDVDGYWPCLACSSAKARRRQ